MVIFTSFVVFEIALVEQVFDRALLVVLDVAVDEDVRDGHADGDADDDRTASTPLRIIASSVDAVMSWMLSRAKSTR